MSKQTIGLVGLGKLGLPIAVSIASRGYKVVGYDVNHHFMKKRPYEHKELGPTLKDDFQDYFDKADLTFLPLKEMLQEADIVFVAVQTPHGPQYEGTTRLPYSRADFDYTWLKEACAQVAKYRRANQTISVISTVLPGTMRREILPHIPDCGYTPSFPAMGTVMNDFLNPEFVLLGADDNITASKLTSFYKEFYNEGDGCSIGSLPICRTSIESAELTKCAYNTMITMRITAINSIMEIAHKIPGCNIDEVSDVLSKATRRIASPAYMRGALGDSGPCLTGDTKISLLDGREMEVKDLVGLPEFYVYSYDIHSKRIVPGRGHSCRLTKKNARLLEVTLDNGEKIRCTPNHPFLLRKGRYVEACDLRPNDRIMPLYRHIGVGGYEVIRHPGYKCEQTHKVVYRWKYGCNSSYQNHAHHKDGDKLNNQPGNLATIGAGRHSSYHNNLPGRKKKQAELMKRLQKEGKINGSETREKTRQRNLTNNPMKNPKYKEKAIRKMTETQRKMVKDGIHHTVVNNPAKRLIKEGRHNFQVSHPMKDPVKLAQMTKNLNEYYSKKAGFASYKESVQVIRKLRFEDKLNLKEIKKKLGITNSFLYSRLRVIDNHRVVSVKLIGRADVYNFEVDTWHNYALSSGVFVHNCHPRDNIAMSWLAERLKLSCDLFDNLMHAREWQTDWLANLITVHGAGMKKVILGKAYKPESAITTGSCALLLANILKEKHVAFEHYDPIVDEVPSSVFKGPACFFIGTKHQEFAAYLFPKGSVVIDPFRYIPDQAGVRIVKIGVGR